MTRPAPGPPRRFAAIEEVYALLRDAGHRVTAQTRFVLERLFATADPISAQQIADDSGDAAIQTSSVYRSLERLEELGVVRHVHLGHGPSLYLLVGGGEREFLVCEGCGRARALDPAALDPIRAEIARRFGYQARFGHFPIVGLCAECAAGAPDGDG